MVKDIGAGVNGDSDVVVASVSFRSSLLAR